MKVTNTIRFEEEKKNLIDNVVNTLEEYKDVICLLYTSDAADE